MRTISLFAALILSCSVAYAEQPAHIDTMTSETTHDKPEVSVATPQDDAKITDSIKSHIRNSPTLSKYMIDVQSKNGEVVLIGNVDSDSNVSSLVELAQSIIGVKDVDAGKLTVQKSEHPLKDMIMTGKIKGLLIREDVFGTSDIASINMSVETKNGVVYLTGVVTNPEQIKNAIKMIEKVKGVKRVEYSAKHVITNPSTSNTTTKPAKQY